MKRTTLILIIYFFLSVRFIIGQNNTYFGVEIGPIFPVYQYADNGNYLYTKPFISTLVPGFYVSRELNKTFIVETGLYFVEYNESYKIIENNYNNVITSGIFVYQIPLKFKARLNLLKEQLFFTSIIGYSFVINDGYNSAGYGMGTYPSLVSNDSIYFVDTSYYNFRKTYSLLETGVALEYHFKNSLILNIGWSYFTGFNRIIEIDVYYWVNDEPMQTATVFSNGDYFSFVLGLKYPISRLWKKREKESGTILDND